MSPTRALKYDWTFVRDFPEELVRPTGKGSSTCWVDSVVFFSKALGLGQTIQDVEAMQKRADKEIVMKLMLKLMVTVWRGLPHGELDNMRDEIAKAYRESSGGNNARDTPFENASRFFEAAFGGLPSVTFDAVKILGCRICDRDKHSGKARRMPTLLENVSSDTQHDVKVMETYNDLLTYTFSARYSNKDKSCWYCYAGPEVQWRLEAVTSEMPPFLMVREPLSGGKHTWIPNLREEPEPDDPRLPSFQHMDLTLQPGGTFAHWQYDEDRPDKYGRALTIQLAYYRPRVISWNPPNHFNATILFWEGSILKWAMHYDDLVNSSRPFIWPKEELHAFDKFLERRRDMKIEMAVFQDFLSA